MKPTFDLKFFSQEIFTLLKNTESKKKKEYEYNEDNIRVALLLWSALARTVTLLKIAIQNPKLQNQDEFIMRMSDKLVQNFVNDISPTHLINNITLISSNIHRLVHDFLKKVQSVDEFLMCAFLAEMYFDGKVSPNQLIANWKDNSEAFFELDKLAQDDLLKFNNELSLWGKAIEENANDSKFCKSYNRIIAEKVPFFLFVLGVIHTFIWGWPSLLKDANQRINNETTPDRSVTLNATLQILFSYSLIFLHLYCGKLDFDRYVLLEKDVRLKMAYLHLSALIFRNFENIPEITSHEKLPNESPEKYEIKKTQLKPKSNFFKPTDKNNIEEKNVVIPKLEKSELVITEDISIPKEKIKTRRPSDLTKSTKLKNESEQLFEQKHAGITTKDLAEVFELKASDLIDISKFGENTFGYWNQKELESAMKKNAFALNDLHQVFFKDTCGPEGETGIKRFKYKDEIRYEIKRIGYGSRVFGLPHSFFLPNYTNKTLDKKTEDLTKKENPKNKKVTIVDFNAFSKKGLH